MEFDGQGSFLKFVIAGAVAGTAEHCGMFPLDTIKTHVQAIRPNGGFLTVAESTSLIRSSLGAKGFFRGITAVMGGAAPAHAVYFSVYEIAKQRLGVHADPSAHQPLESAAAGVAATTASDLIMVPMETVKQRMQLNIRPYASVRDCIAQIIKTEGVFAFWAGYTTTLTMNLPYAGVWFASYESLCKILVRNTAKAHDHSGIGAGEDYDPRTHIVAGAGAGAMASAFTTPFDVAKTRLQTQGDVGKAYGGMMDALRTILKEEGMAGYFRGMVPRVLFHSTAGAIVWTTYEHTKRLLGD